MSALQLRPLRHVLVGGLVVTVVALGTGTALVGRALGRRADTDRGPLSTALEATAVQETRRLSAELGHLQSEADLLLDALLGVAQAPLRADMPIPAARKACPSITLLPGMVRAGVVVPAQQAVPVLVEQGDKGCVDRAWNLGVAVLTGPPFPGLADVQKLVQGALPGVDAAPAETARIIAAWRDGVNVVLRFGVARQGHVAFVDVRPAALEPPAPLAGVRLDSMVTVGGVVAGYIHGGPGHGMIPAAVKRIKAGRDRALELPGVVHEAASRAVAAWLDPVESDAGDLALAAFDAPLEASLPWPVHVMTVASSPWPLATPEVRAGLALVLLLALLLEALVLVLAARKLAGATGRLSRGVRASWAVDHAAEREPTDEERATQLLDALEKGGRDVVEAAYARPERFWAAHAVARLVELVKQRPAADAAKPSPGKNINNVADM